MINLVFWFIVGCFVLAFKIAVIAAVVALIVWIGSPK